ncbi:oxygen-insensitive NADPH nitroreductase [Vibrio anguillarum]|uniref:Oxygen-insensitive NADPH nitroreductase n=1 Tax=Vibrio anguillarum TaxID=55601 RepID=A0AAW4BF57_VIBAN|nr:MULTISPECIES: oxygen-insensitive NADPH nitroreductase [Vibrio]OXX67315.1 NADPH-dependent oxidoreductase [Vibrio sp. V03_P4A6T147]AQP36751.1 nitroreductase A [Vibrio anguillarum]ASG06729.1 NADPH-dependent oxidoreductase [Vibrio anguillarum]ASO28545.1 NADPH-dependent oxidoreductase [Vibrio anguillarum]ATC56868.1 oxygen-insensitive NADPH nitroreductase [Vibrio anguillarum]
MNPVIETILAHRSIRSFTDQKITPDQLSTIISAGIAASSSSLLQVNSIIRVTDKDKREQLAILAGNQAYVASAAEFLVFCIDYQRHYAINPEVKPELIELTLIGAVDAGIMAQNCLLAAESMGLGGVYIGGLRNSPKEVDELLELPPYCAVLFGMCLGYPAQNPQLKPRLSPEVIVHENTYHALSYAEIEQYDETMRAYYQTRSSNTKQAAWSTEVTAKLAQESRPHMLNYLNSKGLAHR